MRWVPAWRRLGRWTLWVAAGLLVFLAVAVVVILSGPGRQRIVDRTVEQLNSILPGDFTVEHATWTLPLKLELQGILWTDGADTLLAAHQAGVAVDLSSLGARHVVIPEVRLVRGKADLAAMKGAFADSSAEPQPVPEKGEGRLPWPLQEGALPGVPSLQVRGIDVELVATSVEGDDSRVRAQLQGSLDLRRGRVPAVRLRQVDLAAPYRQIAVRSDSLSLDLAQGAWAGTLQGEYTEAWSFELRARTRDGIWTLELTETSTPSDDASAGLQLSWAPEGDDPLGRGELDLRVRTPPAKRLRQDPRLTAAIDSLPVELPPLVVRARGTTTLRPEFSTDLDVVVEPSALWREARARADWRGGTLRIEDLVLGDEGVEITGRGRRDASQQDFEVRGRLTDLGWLRRFVAAPPVDSLDISFDVGGGGPLEQTDVELELKGDATVQGRVLEDLELRVRAELGEIATALFDFSVATQPVRAHWGGRVSAGDSLVAQLTPLELRAYGESLDTGSLERVEEVLASRPSRVVVETSTMRVRAQELRVDADGGVVEASGRFEPDVGAEASVTLKTPSAPGILGELVSPELAADLDSVAWDRLSLDLSAQWQAAAPGQSVQARLELRAPGPHHLGPLVPPDLVTEGLEDLLVDFELSASRPDSGEWDADARLDLTQTSWIEGLPLDVRLREGTVQVDTLSLQMLGIDLQGSARSAGDSLRGRWTLGEIDDGTVRARWRSLPPELAFALRGRGQIEGTSEEPRMRTEIAARARQGTIEVPRLELIADTRGAHLDSARVRLRDGVQGIPVAVDSVQIVTQAAPDSIRSPGLLDHWILLEIGGPGIGWMQVARVEMDSLLQVRTDTLAIQWQTRDLSTSSPFLLRWDGKRQRLGIEGLNLQGKLGTVVAQGFLEPDSSDVDARAVLTFPPYPDNVVRSLPRPEELRLGVRSARDGGFDLTLEADELILGEPEPMMLRMSGYVGDSTRVNLQVGPAEGADRLRAAFTLAESPDTAQGSLLQGFAEMDGLALPRQAGNSREVLDQWLRGDTKNPPRLDARAEIVGQMSQPRIEADGRLFFPDDWPLADDDLRFHAVVDTAQSVEGEVEWVRAERTILRATGSLARPVGQDSASPILQASVTAQEFALADLDPLLPPRMTARGRLAIDVEAEGDINQPVMEGTIEGREIFVRLMDGSQVRARADLKLSPATGGGTKANGTVRIEQGLIQIPESGRNLAPKQGKSLLWELEERSPRTIGRDDLELSAADSVVAPTAAEADTVPEPPLLQADINVSIPTGMWIRGRGIEIEMGGELDVEFAGEQPVLVGTLQARAGSLSFLGQRFELQRGDITFYGGDAIDPTLDIVLALEKDGVEVRVLLTGTARDPKLALESDPPMPESDIFSHLLFGEGGEDLSGGQNELLRSETTKALQAFAIPTIERQLSDTLGLDMVRIGRTREGSSQALMAGKYLSPKVLLSYEQSLEEGDSFFVNLRYWITRDLTVESRLGRSDPSSVELNWSVDY